MSYGETGNTSVAENGGPFSVMQTSPSGAATVKSLRDILIGNANATDYFISQGANANDGGLLGALLGKTVAPSGYKAPALTSSGLLQEQQGAFEEAVRMAMGRTSGNYAQRGMNRPENIMAIAGSAAQNVAPAFAPLIAQNVAQRTNEPLVQEDITRKRFADLLQALGLGGNLVGSRGTSSGASTGFNAGYGGSISAGNTSSNIGSQTNNPVPVAE